MPSNRQPVPIIIRPFEARDAEQVSKLVTEGLLNLTPDFNKDAFTRQGLLGKLLGAATVALPAVAVAVLRSAPARIKLPAALAGAALIPSIVALRINQVMSSYIRWSLKSDLSDIPGTYSAEPGSAFWVAELNGEVVGCVGLERKSDDVAELRRMSVRHDMRGNGVGRALALELIAHARKHGFKEIYLDTTSTQRPALALYHKLGWRVTKTLNEFCVSYVTLTLKLV